MIVQSQPHTPEQAVYQKSQGVPSQTNNNQRKTIMNYTYDLNDQIGSGFSSKVFRGKNDKTGEVVAIKVIDMKQIQNEIEQSLLKQEIKAMGLMNSPNVLKMHDTFQTQNNTYIITEFCDQGDLGELIKRCKKIPELEAIKILKHILNGFKEQITKGIIHRDLKPTNIFLKKGIPKIADYGFSKMMNAPKEQVYYNVGTPFYMSPQTIKENKYSEKSDIWSIGVLFYEILYGKCPWNGNSEKELANNMCRLSLIFDQNTPVSEESKDFIRKCLTVDEGKRMSLFDMENHQIFYRRNTTGNLQRVNQASGTRNPLKQLQPNQKPSILFQERLTTGLMETHIIREYEKNNNVLIPISTNNSNNLSALQIQLWNMLNINNFEAILNYGCGQGQILPYQLIIKKKSAKMLACDISNHMIYLCAQRVDQFLKDGRNESHGELDRVEIKNFEKKECYTFPQINLVIRNADAQNLNFIEPEIFEIYFSSQMYHFNENFEKVLQEAYRVLKPQGKIGCGLWGKPENSDMNQIMQRVLKRANMQLHLNSRSQSPLYLCDRNFLIQLFQSQGFEQIFLWSQKVPINIVNEQDLHIFLECPQYEFFWNSISQEKLQEVLAILKDEIINKMLAQQEPLLLEVIFIIATKK